MTNRKRLVGSFVLICVFTISFLFPLFAQGADDVAMAVADAKAAVEQARMAGAEKIAPDDLVQAKSWLAQAEKKQGDSKSILSRTMSMLKSDKEQTVQEITYLAAMATVKARTAEMKARKVSVVAQTKDARIELADDQKSLDVLKKKLAELEGVKAAQARIETERKALDQAKLKSAELDVQKKRELDEAKKKAAALEALKQKELEEARKKSAELDAQKKQELEESKKKAAAFEVLKQKEIEEVRKKTAELEALKQKELAQAKLAAEGLSQQKKKEDAEIKVREAQLAVEKNKLDAMQRKMAAMEKEKAMQTAAAKIPHAAVKSTEKEIVITLLTANLLTPKNVISPEGRGILDQTGAFLRQHAAGSKVVIRGYTDGAGKAAAKKAKPLSEKQAQAVRQYLVLSQDIPAARLAAEGLGSAQPVASNATEAGRVLNRRVEILVPLTK
jgi:chemotaxis protein MotB